MSRGNSFAGTQVRGEGMPDIVRSFSGMIPVRFEKDPRGPTVLSATTLYRGIKDMEESTILRVLSLDPNRFRVVMGPKRLDGFVLMGNLPVATILVLKDEKHDTWDRNPTSTQDWADFSRH
jgi:hypothetical protein